jgi:hypothetical protein
VTSAAQPLTAEPLDKPLYTKAALILLAVLLIVSAARFSGYSIRASQTNAPTDFHAFYVAAQLVWRGSIDQAYHFSSMLRHLKELTGGETFLPWSYPPQYNLIVAPLPLLPLGAAYLLFTTATLLAYLATLRRLSGPNFTPVLLSILPAVAVTIACGQNGFLTGTLVGLACIGLLHRRSSAGLPLGLMVIKPHLVVGLALYTLLTCRWRVAFVAVLTVAITAALATATLGTGVWTAFLGGFKEMRVFLEAGLYPLFRMISLFGALRSLGAPAAAALACQAALALLSLAVIGLAVRRRMAVGQQLGIAVLGSLLISPYAYDYDLMIYGIGLALLLPDLLRLATPREQAAVFGLSFFASAWGLAKTTVIELQFGTQAAPLGKNVPASLGGIALAVLMLLIWRILSRGVIRS